MFRTINNESEHEHCLLLYDLKLWEICQFTVVANVNNIVVVDVSMKYIRRSQSGEPTLSGAQIVSTEGTRLPSQFLWGK